MNDVTVVALPGDAITVVSMPQAHKVTHADVGLQGPPGPPGTSYERVMRLDGSRPIAYAGFADRIERMDYSTWPPTVTSASTADLATDWPNRAGLNYT